MNKLYPIHTLFTECHDCYKCLRQCPVKAIKIDNGHASIMSEKCVACGRCVRVCPSHAKYVRQDIDKVKFLFRSKAVYVSLAPSYLTYFANTYSAKQLIYALKKLGFTGVSETALGAQEVSKAITKRLSQEDSGLFISTACPSTVDYIRLYLPQYAQYLTSLASPALTHAKMIKEHFGDQVGVVFVGPCIAKKNESDHHSELIDVSLTFDELQSWLEENKLNDPLLPEDSEGFLLGKSKDGAIYPVEGGMTATLQHLLPHKKIQYHTVVGLVHLKEALEGLQPKKLSDVLFIESLACRGGCVNGPGAKRSSSILESTYQLWKSTSFENEIQTEAQTEVIMEYRSRPIVEEVIEPARIKEALARVGKNGIEDELNCGGCGYNTCRAFAKALVLKNAEISMCLSFMRMTAHKKSNALLRSIPCGVVIADKNLEIIESNTFFSTMFGKEVELAADVNPTLAGAHIEKILPCADLFKAALRSGGDIKKEHYPIGDRLFDLTIFTVEPKQTVGAIVVDVTKSEIRRDQIARMAREVISRNVLAVQEIACRLGEHMADTEVILSSIAEGYSSDDSDENKN